MYVRVTEEKAGESFEVATAVTSGTTETLCVGKPGIFFTTDGREWDAVVVDLLPNPVSLGEAVKHPFKRLAGFIGAQWEKLTARFYTDAEKNIGTGIDSLQKPAAAKGGKASAARDLLLGGGVAFAALGGVATYLTKTIAEIGPAGILKVVGTVALVILATTVITAVVKLRRRNLSTVLEASGWAVNTHMRLTRRIGKIFTFVPKHPGEARLRRRDDVDRLLKKIPAAGHRPLAWVMAVVLAAVLGVTAGLAAAPYVSRGLVRFLGMESALSDTQVLRKTRPGALRPEPKPGSGAPQESG
jgi:hypothetical protein